MSERTWSLADLPTRFRSKIEPTADGCWTWQAATTNGYGVYWDNVECRVRMAHRWAYEHLIGAVPDELPLDHLCRNRSCVYPAHLEPVTHQVNILRGVGATARNAAKTHCSKGHPYDEANTWIDPTGRRKCRQCYPPPQHAGHQRTWTHCIHGHLFDDRNTYIRPNGSRACRACLKARKRQYRAEGRMA